MFKMASEGVIEIQKKAKHTKCAKCNVFMWKVSGQKKVISAIEEAQKLQSILNKSIHIGDELCNKCRKVLYNKKRSENSEKYVMFIILLNLACFN